MLGFRQETFLDPGQTCQEGCHFFPSMGPVRLRRLKQCQLHNDRLVLITSQENAMALSTGMKACGIGVLLAFQLGACGGGGGEPGVSPQANNGADTRLHPETYVERWWPECPEGKPCATAPSR